MAVYAIFTEDGLDQEVYTHKQATKEAKDLRKLGCTVTVFNMKGNAIGTVLEAMTERVRDMKPLTKAWLGKLEAQHAVTILKTKG